MFYACITPREGKERKGKLANKVRNLRRHFREIISAVYVENSQRHNFGRINYNFKR